METAATAVALPEDVVALVPMRNVVLFPQVLLPITVGRARSSAAHCSRADPST
jgi:ATP-dependent Lon protease